MINFLKGIGVCLLLIVYISSAAQKTPPLRKFGDIKADDFSPATYSLDSNANAVVLFDIGSSKYEGDTRGGFSVVYNRHKRIRLLNKNAFDLATVSLNIYSSGSMEEKISSLEASTYNLENGKVEVYKLDKASIFSDKFDRSWSVKKFTLPHLKEGSIIEIKYTLTSPYERYIRSWNFQGSEPRLWSEYTVTIPEVYEYITNTNGKNVYTIDEFKDDIENYNILVPGATAGSRSEPVNFKSNTTVHKWAMKDVPALKEENFTTTMDNHIAKIDFQLSRIKFPESPVKDVMRTWYAVSEDLLKDEDFGAGLYKQWMAEGRNEKCNCWCC